LRGDGIMLLAMATQYELGLFLEIVQIRHAGLHVR